MAMKENDVPDIVLPRQPVTLRCPVCGLERNLPTNWRELIATDPPEGWDGNMRCTKDQVVMEEVVTTEEKPDGSVELLNPRPPW